MGEEEFVVGLGMMQIIRNPQILAVHSGKTAPGLGAGTVTALNTLRSHSKQTLADQTRVYDSDATKT